MDQFLCASLFPHPLLVYIVTCAAERSIGSVEMCDPDIIYSTVSKWDDNTHMEYTDSSNDTAEEAVLSVQ